MKEKSKRIHTHIECFNPDVVVLSDWHQDFSFSAGEEYDNFNVFVAEEAIEYAEEGDGVTYLVFNVFLDENGRELSRELVSYYTLSSTAIPYIDRIRLDEDEAKEKGKEFSDEIWGIPALEIKMFAVDEKYQDVFFEFEGEDLPIAAWIIRNIINKAYSLMSTVVGFKALFLHALPNAEKFYEKNGFNSMKNNMQPLQCVDSEYRAMYLALKEVHMNYDE
ncbi:hypothetical protein ABXS75_15265 [Roseburia hominis]